MHELNRCSGRRACHAEALAKAGRLRWAVARKPFRVPPSTWPPYYSRFAFPLLVFSIVSTYPLALNIISDCWILFTVIWLIAAFWTKRSVYKESRWQRLGYVIPILVGGYLVFKGQRLSDPLNLRVIPHVDALAWIGVVLCSAGLAFCVWARFTLGRNWSGVVTFKGGHELITRGPYALVRHPIYTGLLTMFVATVIVLGHVAGIIALPLVFASIWIKLLHEEKLMLEKFPDQYAAYQCRVKRLIPFIL
jgi:protein-S-isoprenylcysteine O-methyltransferase Ste14